MLVCVGAGSAWFGMVQCWFDCCLAQYSVIASCFALL